MLGALLAAGCHPRTKYGVDTDTGDDTGDAEFETVAAPPAPQAPPLPEVLAPTITKPGAW